MSEDAILHETNNKSIALLIAVLALVLAFGEAGANNARNLSIQKNIQASDLWSFFQAKTIRRTVLLTAAETAALTPASGAAKQIETWKATAERYQSEPSTNEGAKELAARAQAAEHERDLENHRFEIYELATHLLQVAIVLASAMIITGVAALAWLAGGMGLLAAALMGFAKLAPFAMPFI
jgi:hypothetical protein